MDKIWARFSKGIEREKEGKKEKKQLTESETERKMPKDTSEIQKMLRGCHYKQVYA